MRHRGEKNITEDIHYEGLSTETDGEAEDSGASDERADIDAEPVSVFCAGTDLE